MSLCILFTYAIYILPSSTRVKSTQRSKFVNSDFFSTSVICIGFSVRGLDLNDLPGWGVGSVGYHGDDGILRNSDTDMKIYAFRATFGTGDTVGCGITLNREKIFFTKNGIIIGELHHSSKRGLQISNVTMKPLFDSVFLSGNLALF